MWLLAETYETTLSYRPLFPDSASGTQSSLLPVCKIPLIRAERVAKICPTITMEEEEELPLSISRAIKKRERKKDHFFIPPVFGDWSWREVREATSFKSVGSQ